EGLHLLVSLRYSSKRARRVSITIPPEAPRLVAVPTDRQGSRRWRFILLEDLFRASLPDVFPEASVEAFSTFRLLRNADFLVHNIDAGNLVEKVRLGIARREHGEPVALQIELGADPNVRRLLTANLELADEDVYEVERPLGLSGLFFITDLR